MELCEKEEYRCCTINVYYDDTPEDPRTWGNVATFVCEHRRYNLGDEQDIEGRIDSLFGDYVPAKAVIDHFVKLVMPILFLVKKMIIATNITSIRKLCAVKNILVT